MAFQLDLAHLDLSTSAFFFDFNTAVALADVDEHLLQRLAGEEWKALRPRLAMSRELEGRIGLAQRWALLSPVVGALVDPPSVDSLSGASLFHEVAGEIGVDPAFGSRVARLREEGAEVTVVCDGFGFYVASACESFDVQVLSNTVDFTTGQLVYPHLDRCCPCSTCGMCKQAPIEDAKRRGRRAVFVSGDLADRKAALLADVLVASGALAHWCEIADVASTDPTELNLTPR